MFYKVTVTSLSVTVRGLNFTHVQIQRLVKPLKSHVFIEIIYFCGEKKA